eukprot:9144128-Pyramimonas_sp.AAC.1
MQDALHVSRALRRTLGGPAREAEAAGEGSTPRPWPPCTNTPPGAQEGAAAGRETSRAGEARGD